MGFGNLGATVTQHLLSAVETKDAMNTALDRAEAALAARDCSRALESLVAASDLRGQTAAHQASATTTGRPLKRRALRTIDDGAVERLRVAFRAGCVKR